jgi:hypothetical protein
LLFAVQQLLLHGIQALRDLLQLLLDLLQLGVQVSTSTCGCLSLLCLLVCY